MYRPYKFNSLHEIFVFKYPDITTIQRKSYKNRLKHSRVRTLLKVELNDKTHFFGVPSSLGGIMTTVTTADVLRRSFISSWVKVVTAILQICHVEMLNTVVIHYDTSIQTCSSLFCFNDKLLLDLLINPIISPPSPKNCLRANTYIYELISLLRFNSLKHKTVFRKKNKKTKSTSICLQVKIHRVNQFN